MVKTIYLLRHAKSSWDNAELEDHDRPLSKRGRRSAGALAAYLERSQIGADLVVCSSAERARQTLDLVSRAIKPPKVILDRNVYEAGPRKLMKYLCQLPETAETVFLIGHNPALHEFALSLADPTSAKRLPPVTGKFPTAALATFEFDGQWSGLAPHSARVTSFVIPADLQDDAREQHRRPPADHRGDRHARRAADYERAATAQRSQGEPPLDDVLTGQTTKSMMKADNVDRQELEQVIADAKEKLSTITCAFGPRPPRNSSPDGPFKFWRAGVEGLT